MSSKKPADDAPPRAPLLISLDLSLLVQTLEEQSNRIEMLELQLRKKDEEFAAMSAAVAVSAVGGEGGGVQGGGVIHARRCW